MLQKYVFFKYKKRRLVKKAYFCKVIPKTTFDS